MNPPILFEAEAEAEFIDAGRWYESRRAGLGIEFFEAIDALRVLAIAHDRGELGYWKNRLR